MVKILMTRRGIAKGDMASTDLFGKLLEAFVRKQQGYTVFSSDFLF